MNAAQPSILSVNYWPRRKALYRWHDFNPADAGDEMMESAR